MPNIPVPARDLPCLCHLKRSMHAYKDRLMVVQQAAVFLLFSLPHPDIIDNHVKSGLSHSRHGPAHAIHEALSEGARFHAHLGRSYSLDGKEDKAARMVLQPPRLHIEKVIHLNMQEWA